MLFLIVILIIAGMAGYFLAKSQYSKPVDEVASKVATTSQGYAGQASDWLRGLFQGRSKTEQLRAWAAGPGAAYLPDDFKVWLASLTPNEAEEFTKSLDSYASGLGYDLDKLVKGELDAQQPRGQAFVEAVVAYSQAYRHSRQARQEAEQAVLVEDNPPSAPDGKPQAEKAVSRRRSDSGEIAQPSSVD